MKQRTFMWVPATIFCTPPASCNNVVPPTSVEAAAAQVADDSASKAATAVLMCMLRMICSGVASRNGTFDQIKTQMLPKTARPRQTWICCVLNKHLCEAFTTGVIALIACFSSIKYVLRT
jgi:hypothetical protein